MKNTIKNLKLQTKNQSGFTLIELLVVILIIGVLAAGLLALIDPIGKVQQAQDAGMKDAVAQMAAAEQSYYSTAVSGGTAAFAGTNSNTDAFSALQTAGEMKTTATLPTRTDNTPYPITIHCSVGGVTPNTACNAAGVTDFSLAAPMQHGTTAGDKWCYKSVTGKATEILSATTCNAY